MMAMRSAQSDGLTGDTQGPGTAPSYAWISILIEKGDEIFNALLDFFIKKKIGEDEVFPHSERRQIVSS